MRAEAVLQACDGRSFRHDPCRKAVRIHRLDVRVPDDVDLLRRELGEVFLPGTRIGGKILARRKLRRIDEDRDDDPFRAPPGQAYQRHMAVMECTHGGHQRDGGFLVAKILDGAAQGGDRADDLGASRHLDSGLTGVDGRCAFGLAAGRGDLTKRDARPPSAGPADGHGDANECRTETVRLIKDSATLPSDSSLKAERKRFACIRAHFT